jgi:hypothetical protein
MVFTKLSFEGQRKLKVGIKEKGRIIFYSPILYTLSGRIKKVFKT